jgi:DNA-binding CsgD family transcriptional regulator
MRLPAADLEQGLALVDDWHRAGSLDELAECAVVGLRRLIPADGVGWNEIDVAGREIRIIVDPPDYLAPPLEALARLIHQNPIVTYTMASGDGGAVAFSDFLSVREYHRRELYGEFYRPLGVEDQLACVLQVGSPLVGVAFNRGARSFRERDRALLNVLRPHLRNAYDHVSAQAVAQERLEALERGLEQAGRTVAIVRGGRVDALSERGRRLLAHWFGDRPPPLPAPGERLVVEHPDRRLELRLAAGRPPLLLLDETRLEPDPQRARALGLTRREAEILALAARGLDNPSIASELGTSVRTVHKHLENAFRKLAVRDRRAAVARLLDR